MIIFCAQFLLYGLIAKSGQDWSPLGKFLPWQMVLGHLFKTWKRAYQKGCFLELEIRYFSSAPAFCPAVGGIP
jgi:hypothetical protein